MLTHKMPSPEPIASTFPVAFCKGCGKSVVTCVALDDDGLERRMCAHCDAPIAVDIEWISATELESTGYYIGTPSAPRAGGCGGGCSSGACGTRKQQ